MTRIDLDTLEAFNGVISDKNELVFIGSEKGTTFRLKPDLRYNQTHGFYQILNPLNTGIITDVYIFNVVTDAVVFFSKQHPDFFKSALVVVVDESAKNLAAKKLLSELRQEGTPNHRKSNVPKLHFYHRGEKADLFLFYLEMLKIDIYYNIIYISKNLYIKIKYKSLSLTLSFRELKRLRMFLGITDRKFKIKNNELTLRSVNEIISW